MGQNFAVAVVLQRDKYPKQADRLNMREPYISAQIAEASWMHMNRFVRYVAMKFEIERLQIRFVSLPQRFKKSKNKGEDKRKSIENALLWTINYGYR